ncbi:MAG: pyridoxal phosphate-dependent aminotransferase [Saprospiraceae bacterium]|nr:pyridoxal phosphate-dependent aminotransferase [Saprospiraceae bacterium]
MLYKRMPIEIEAPEEKGYNNILYNLAESSVRDIKLGDLNIDLSELILCYGEHRGDLALRKAIVQNFETLNPKQVLICPSAATALFIISTTLLSSDDHLIVLRPNYATNLETPRAIQCEMDLIELDFDTDFDWTVQQFQDKIKPNTKLISITNPHNPTGKVYTPSQIQALIDLAKANDAYLLVDETYRDLYFQQDFHDPLYTAALDPCVISVASVSKAYGTPGIRIGWLINQDPKLMEDFLAAKEQIIISNSVVDEAIALHVLQNRPQLLKPAHAHIHQNFQIVKHWLENEQNFLEWIEPQAGVIGFPRIKHEYQLDFEQFHEILFHDYQTMLGRGHWFERSKRYMRLGFGYPTAEELKNGLENIQTVLSLLLKS